MVSPSKPLMRLLAKLGIKSANKQFRMQSILRAMPLKLLKELADGEPDHIP